MKVKLGKASMPQCRLAGRKADLYWKLNTSCKMIGAVSSEGCHFTSPCPWWFCFGDWVKPGVILENSVRWATRESGESSQSDCFIISPIVCDDKQHAYFKQQEPFLVIITEMVLSAVGHRFCSIGLGFWICSRLGRHHKQERVESLEWALSVNQPTMSKH